MNANDEGKSQNVPQAAATVRNVTLFVAEGIHGIEPGSPRSGYNRGEK